MSFLSNLFGGSKTPTPPPPIPTIGAGTTEAAARAVASRRGAATGPDQTILSGLGNPGSASMATSGTVKRTSLLGGG